MKTQTTAAARQQRLNSWAQMVYECQNRPIGMTVDEWCVANSIKGAQQRNDVAASESFYESLDSVPVTGPYRARTNHRLSRWL